MPTITGLSGTSLASVAQAQARAATPATATKAATSAAPAADTVTLSAEAKAQLAGGKPFFATADAEGTASADSAAVGKNEARRKQLHLAQIKQRASDVQERGAGKLEELTKRGAARKDRIGGRVQDEQSIKKERAGDQVGRLGKQEEATKSRAGDRADLLTEQAKKTGLPVDQGRLDRLGDRVKAEEVRKAGRLEAADERRLVTEAKVKARARDKLKRGDLNTEERTKRIGQQTDKKLGKLEQRVKRLDRSDAGGEQKIKATDTAAATSTAEAAQAAATKTDVI